MKNLLFFIAILLTSSALSAQFSNERVRNLQLLSISTNEIMQSDATVESKEARVIKLFGDYMKSYSAIISDKELDSIVKDIESDNKCNKAQIMEHLATFKEDNQRILSPRYIASKGDIRSDCALKSAVRLYSVLGNDAIAEKSLCRTGNCDNKTAVRSMSRGEKTYWKYTGEKQFVADKDVLAWRYKCIQVTKVAERETVNNDEQDTRSTKQAPITDESEIGRPYGDDGVSPVNYVRVMNSQPEWKKVDLVDLW